VTRLRNLLATALLRTPKSLRELRKAPVIGFLLHKLSYVLLKKDQKVWVCVERGAAKDLWLELSPRTGQAYLRGEAEAAVQEFLAGRLRPNDVFYDLGANIGLFSLLAARIVGTGGKVFSFEPDPENADRLRRNVSRNGFGNISVVQAGVWSSSGDRHFKGAEDGSPDRGVGAFVEDGSHPAVFSVACVSLDDFTRTAPYPSGIKCDVEGGELEVLEGARELLGCRHPWILCEVHSEENGQRLRGLLEGYGYSFEVIDSSHLFAEPPSLDQ
jgi:FkbM family methyltransferase